VPFSYVWVDTLEDLKQRRPDKRIVNLETAVTQAELPAPKGINYRMNPANSPVLSAAEIDCCILANNHVLDWGDAGLLDTLGALDHLGIARTGAGADLLQATSPAGLPLPRGGRVLVFGCGSTSSGIPGSWAATKRRAGVNLLPDFSLRTVSQIAAGVDAARRTGDIVVMSVHWGPNWGYQIVEEDIAFAHALVDEAGVDVVHGHSSHHPKAIEVYRGKPIFYGCGDFLNDYEGISGYEAFRGDLVLAYFPRIDATTGALERLDIVPYQIRNFRLNRASERDAAWLCTRFAKLEQKFGARMNPEPDGSLALAWG
jgi:poly-gamma-glutamate synthesis protein (capsule biosynthesis protein)